jgi:hypothetical protein
VSASVLKTHAIRRGLTNSPIGMIYMWHARIPLQTNAPVWNAA